MKIWKHTECQINPCHNWERPHYPIFDDFFYNFRWGDILQRGFTVVRRGEIQLCQILFCFLERKENLQYNSIPFAPSVPSNPNLSCLTITYIIAFMDFRQLWILNERYSCLDVKLWLWYKIIVFDVKLLFLMSYKGLMLNYCCFPVIVFSNEDTRASLFWSATASIGFVLFRFQFLSDFQMGPTSR